MYTFKLTVAALPLLLANCMQTPATAPTQPTLSTAEMSVAARRFEQFCVAAIGSSTDGVDRANAFYKTNPLPPLGGLKISGSAKSADDISVQYNIRKRGCMVTSSQGKAPNGQAELLSVANRYAAANSGLVRAHNKSVVEVTTSNGIAKFQYWDARGGLAFLVEEKQR